jgi:hypothetical protein
MYEMKCEDESNVRTHLENLMKTQEQLAGMNAALSDDELITVILGSLPKSYRPLINAISMSGAHAKVNLEPDRVVGTLTDEFERLAIEERQLKANENALVTAKGHEKSQARGNKDIECWKCRKLGHIKADCRSKAKKNEDHNKGSGSANIATEDEEFTFTTSFSGSSLALGMSQLTG